MTDASNPGPGRKAGAAAFGAATKATGSHNPGPSGFVVRPNQFDVVDAERLG